MLILIDKEDVLDALETEPLYERGNFLRTRGRLGCSVCAVGGVLRHAGVRDITHTALRACDQTAGYGDVAPRDNYLSALSIVWETLTDDASYAHAGPRPYLPGPEERAAIIAWAEDNIPDEWETTIEVAQ